MSDAEWFEGDDPALRKMFGHMLRDHVAYQDGRHSEAPTLVFADADYEVGDGSCALHEDGKRANEPAIVYARADALMHLDAENRALRARIAGLEAKANDRAYRISVLERERNAKIHEARARIAELEDKVAEYEHPPGLRKR